MILNHLNESYNIILASVSPRRQQLLHEMGLDFDILKSDVDESLPTPMSSASAATYLAELKSRAFTEKDLPERFLLITADTLVSMNGHIMGKPNSKEDAVEMLQQLSGGRHEVISGVCIRTALKIHSFLVQTEVLFRPFTEEEILFYIEKYHPYDKAGSYGIQEWIGLIGVESIKGSFYNVMGLPTQALYQALKQF